MAEMTTKKLTKTPKEEKTSGMDGRLMSMHANILEVRDSNWSTQSRKELQKALTNGEIKENHFTREIANLD